jgi:hypothetical protein
MAAIVQGNIRRGGNFSFTGSLVFLAIYAVLLFFWLYNSVSV